MIPTNLLQALADLVRPGDPPGAARVFSAAAYHSVLAQVAGMIGEQQEMIRKLTDRVLDAGLVPERPVAAAHGWAFVVRDPAGGTGPGPVLVAALLREAGFTVQEAGAPSPA